MSTSSGRAPSPSGEPQLDARVCAEIGAELARVRVERGLTVAQVGEKLLLSSRQVRGLEEVEFAAFHNATFHLKALKKYAALAELPPARLAALAPDTARPASALLDTAMPANGRDDEGPSRRGLMVVLSTLVVVGALAAGGYMLWARQAPVTGATAAAAAPAPVSAPTSPEPPAPNPPEPPAPPTEAQSATVTSSPFAPTGSGASPVVPAAFGTLRVPRPTWIFVRDADNVVIERSLAGGESIELVSQPTYLAVGLPDAELLIGDRRVDLSGFVTNGQIRMRAGDLDAAMQEAFPIQAPTAAARP